jgi:hypothetical protein
MTSIEDSANNRIVPFLLDNPAPCERSVCTTCGGRLHFLLRLRQAFPNEDDLVKSLKTLTGTDVSQMRNDQNCMPQVLNSLSEDVRKTILESWMQNIMNDRDLALAILLWTQYGKSLPQSMVYELLLAAESLLISSRKLRDNLRKLLQILTELPPGLKSAIEKDMCEEEEKLKAAYLAAKERNDYLDGLASISFTERVPRILVDQSIKYQDWREIWSICTDGDIETLKAEDVQKLIDLCEANQSYRWTDALKKLYDKRHQLRLAAIERFRHQYGQMNPHEQLSLLIRNLTVPIEHYPVELAQYVTPHWLETLTKEERDHFSELLNHTHLRTWKKVRERCGNDDKIT